jgi:hypothetical protein
VWAVNQAEDVAEWVDDRRRDEPRFPLDNRLIFGGAQLDQPCNGSWDVVDLPVNDRSAGITCGTRRRVAAVDETKLVLIGPDPELDVGGGPLLGAQ